MNNVITKFLQIEMYGKLPVWTGPNSDLLKSAHSTYVLKLNCLFIKYLFWNL